VRGGVLKCLARGVGFQHAETLRLYREVTVAERPRCLGQPFQRRGEPCGLTACDHGGQGDGGQREQRHRGPRPVHASGDEAVRHGRANRPDRLLVGWDRGEYSEVEALDADADLGLRATGRQR
jgi:hypothetical protein